jgi:hypothetical protein
MSVVYYDPKRTCTGNIYIATRTFFRCTILYKEGYCTTKGASPNQISAQKRRVDPSLILKDPLLKKSFSILISSFKKWESVGFASTCAKVLPRHLSSPMMHLLHFFSRKLKNPQIIWYFHCMPYPPVRGQSLISNHIFNAKQGKNR